MTDTPTSATSDSGSPPAGTREIDAAAFFEAGKTVVTSLLDTADEVAKAWRSLGVSLALFTFGTLVAGFDFVARYRTPNSWNDTSFIGALGFALAAWVLGYVAFDRSEIRAGIVREQTVDALKAQAQASIEGQRLGAEERASILAVLESLGTPSTTSLKP